MIVARTGMSADERLSVRPSDMPAVAAMLMARLGGSKLDVAAVEKRLRDSANRTYTDENGATSLEPLWTPPEGEEPVPAAPAGKKK